MTENEKELLELVRNNPHPDAALAVAIEIISDFLKRLESSR